MNKKINKRNCEDNLGGSFIEEEECTQEMMNQAGIGEYFNFLTKGQRYWVYLSKINE